MAEPKATGSASDDARQVYVRTTSAGHCWYVNGVVVDCPFDWLIDTGAAPNVLDQAVYLKLPERHRPTLRQSSARLCAADGGVLQVHGETTLDLLLGNKLFRVPVMIADLGDVQGILGMEFLNREACLIDAFNGKLHFPDREVFLHRGATFQCCRVRLKESLEIQPDEERIICGQVDEDILCESRGVGVIEADPSFVLDSGLLVARALVDVKGATLKLTVGNLGDDPVIIPAGTTVAWLDPVEVVYLPGDIDQDDDNEFPRHRVSAILESSKALPEYLQPVVDTATGNLTSEQRDRLQTLIAANQGLFVGPDGKLGRTDLVKHGIDTGDARPIKQGPRSLPISQQMIAEEEVDKMLKQGVIEPSDSPWAAPVVLVTKKDGSTRFCVDYRRLNDLTRKDAYPLPVIGDCLDALHGSQWFHVLDLASSYWQLEMEETSKPKTAFVTRSGLYQFNFMPFGLTNGCATFQRLMELVLRGLQWERCLLYLDDVIVLGKDFDDSLRNLKCVFARLRDAGLKLKPKKCEFFQKEVSFLGHVVGSTGVACDPAKLEAVTEWKTPQSVTEVRSFLGLASYYRRFIMGFAKVAAPLTALTEKGCDFEWTESCENAFQTLKCKLVEAPILAYPSRSLEDPFILDTDASDVGLGGVLSQVQDGQEKVIAYASKTLSKPQRQYCTTYKELLAVVTFVKHFRHYLLGRRFTVRTDHSSLRWLLNFKDIEGMVGRWVTYLSQFDYIIEHRKGILHGNADGLSRKVPKHRRRRCGREECDECTRRAGDAVGRVCEDDPRDQQTLGGQRGGRSRLVIGRTTLGSDERTEGERQSGFALSPQSCPEGCAGSGAS